MLQLSPRRWLLASLMLALVLACATRVFFVPQPQRHAALHDGTTSQVARSYGFPALSVDAAAIADPVLVAANEANVDDEEIVIGVVVDGQARAYLRQAFDGAPWRHAVADAIASTPLVVTHCDRVRCTRVLASPQPCQPLDVRIGGWREDQTMELIVNEQPFSQKSPHIPLIDVPFSEMAWGQWRKQHPDTLIYLGKSQGDREELAPSKPVAALRQWKADS